MATRDGGQQHRSPRRTSEDEELTEVKADEDAQARKEALDEDVDSLLDEIDETLETNSEEFVRGFVQKGGE